MNYKYYTIVILGLLAFSACEKDDIDIPATDNEVNQWIEQTMRENYLWYSEFPDKSSLDFSLDPETFFKGLLSDKDGKDLPEGHHYFSQLEKAIFEQLDSWLACHGFIDTADKGDANA